jgi:hypothetical protein
MRLIFDLSRGGGHQRGDNNPYALQLVGRTRALSSL